MTDHQMEYLLLFATQSSRGRYISNAAEEFGVSLPSASNIGATLERDGLIRKAKGGVVELTEPARLLIAPKITQMKQLEEWLEIGLGLPPNRAEREARRMTAFLRDETVDGMIRYWQSRASGDRGGEIDPFFRNLEPGTYQAPFQVYKKDCRELSMGDRGFRKPARLICGERDRYFLLYPVELQHMAHGRQKRHTGQLARLWYRRGLSWYETEEARDGAQRLSCAAVTCAEGPEGLAGTARIRVRATVSTIKMPESEADLVFDLSKLRSEPIASKLETREHRT